MILSPIIPIWLMIIITIILIIFIIKSRKNKKTFIKEILIISLLFIMNLRVMIPSDNARISANDLDVLFIIDNTISMDAEDYAKNQTRLSKVKEDCKYIIQKLNGARFSVISFNSESYILIPYINDTDLTFDTIDIINTPQEYNARGSSLNAPMENMETILASSEEKSEKIRIVFFISDGEITDESTLKSYSSLKNYVDNGAVLGYGTTKGGNMQVTDYNGLKKYLTYYDESYNKKLAVSKIDENNLNSIAKDLGIDYIHMLEQENIDSKLDEILSLSKQSISDVNKISYTDTYYIFAIPLIIILFLTYKKVKEEYSL